MVGAPFFEELFFRGVAAAVPGPPVRHGGRLGGAGPGHHRRPACSSGWPTPSPSSSLGLAVFGIILSLVSYRTGRLGMNMVAHATFNLMAVAAAVVAPWPPRGVLF